MKFHRVIVGKNVTPQAVMRQNFRKGEERWKKETARLKQLKLGPSRENEYDYRHRMYVPRARLIGSDGVVRTRRTRNEEPLKRPKDSEYARLYLAFLNIRRQGVDARWNISGQTYMDYYGELPLKKPGLFHWKADGSHNKALFTGMEWTRDWECVQDSVTLNAISGTTDIAVEILDSHGFKTIVDPYDHDNEDYIKLVFRGSGKVCSGSWHWADNCWSENPIDPPPIG
jgi:hypothetical protein